MSKFKPILYSFIALIVLTIPFWVFDIDMSVQRLLFDSELNTWIHEANPFVLLLYNYGTYLGLIFGALAIVVFGLSFVYKMMNKHRRAALIIIFTTILGPVLLVNVLSKSYTGRPRPRDVAEFNGKWKYQNVFVMGAPGRGHSFPCGHSSVGFTFMALFLAYRKKYRKTAFVFLVGGLLYGTAMGLGRMMQGAHFLSDVLWSGGMVWLSALAVDAFLPDKIGVFKIADKKAKVLAWSIIPSLLVLLVLFAILSTPFYRERIYNIPVGDNLRITVHTSLSDIEIMRSKSIDKIRVEMIARGFGVSGAEYKDVFEHSSQDGTVVVDYSAVKNGFFTELMSDVKVYIPQKTSCVLVVNNQSGDVNCDAGFNIKNTVLYTGKGDVTLISQENSKIGDIFIKTQKGNISIDLKKGTHLNKVATIVADAKNGRVVFKDSDGFFEGLNSHMNGSKELRYEDFKNKGRILDIVAGKKMEVFDEQSD